MISSYRASAIYVKVKNFNNECKNRQIRTEGEYLNVRTHVGYVEGGDKPQDTWRGPWERVGRVGEVDGSRLSFRTRTS